MAGKYGQTKKKKTAKQMQQKLWFDRKLLSIQWTEKRKNKSVFEELPVKPELLSTINRRKFRYLSHANRNTKANLMTTVLKDSRGRLKLKGTEEDHQPHTCQTSLRTAA